MADFIYGERREGERLQADPLHVECCAQGVRGWRTPAHRRASPKTLHVTLRLQIGRIASRQPACRVAIVAAWRRHAQGR